MPAHRLPALLTRFGREFLELIGGVTLIGLVLVAVDLQVVRPSFEALEEHQALEDNDRVAADLERELTGLAGQAGDWAGRDRVCATGGPEPEAAALSTESNVDLFVCLDASGRTVQQTIFHPLIGGPVPLRALLGDPPALVAALAPAREQHLARNGLLATEHGLLLLAARPLPPTGIVPPQGLLLLGRFFTRGDVILMSERTRVRADLLDRAGLQGTEQELFARLVAGAERRPVQAGRFAYRLLVDIDRQPFALLRTAARGEITALGRQAGQALTVLLGSISMTLLVFLVISRSRARASRRALAESEARLRQLHKEKSLGRMAAAIAHHFNNQLTAISGFIQLAMHRPGRRAAGEDAELTEALLATGRAAELSGLMLTYLGLSMAERSPLDLAEVCRNSLADLPALLPGDQELVTDMPAPGPMVRANAAQLRLVLSNLVINAAEAVTDGPGRLEVTVRTVAAADLSAANRFPVDWQPTAPAYACLQVADNGSGIVPDDIEQLFDPFFTSKFTGRGLGLAVVLGVVKAGGGAVSVTSEAGRGSVFAVYLPLAGPGGETRPAAA